MTNNLIDSNEAAEMDAAGIYVVEQPSLGEQVITTFVLTLVPLVALGAAVGVVAGIQKGADAWTNHRNHRRAIKAAKKVVVEETPDTEE